MTTVLRATIIAALAATPAALSDALTTLGPARADDAAAGEWSLADVVRHVRASDAIVATRIMHILVRDNPPLTAWDDVAWAQLFASAAIPLADQLTGFALRRSELVAILRALNEEQWRRTGTHELAGPLTLESIAASIVEHEAEHIAQAKGLLRR